MATRKKKTPERPFYGEYEEVQPLLWHIRIMQRFFDEIIDKDAGVRDRYADLHVTYMDILNEEFAPHALLFALAVTQLEDQYPQIRRDQKT